MGLRRDRLLREERLPGASVVSSPVEIRGRSRRALPEPSADTDAAGCPARRADWLYVPAWLEDERPWHSAPGQQRSEFALSNVRSDGSDGEDPNVGACREIRTVVAARRQLPFLASRAVRK